MAGPARAPLMSRASVAGFGETGVPTFDYFHSVGQTEDGNQLATVSKSQWDNEHLENVSMPAFFYLGKDEVLARDRPVPEPDDEVHRVKLSGKPESVALGDSCTLLADIVR